MKNAIIAISITLGVFAVIGAIGSSLEEGPSKYELRNILEKGLRDPSSASYQNEYIHKGLGNIKYLCGEVNAKNGFGGLTGYRRFVSSELGAFVETSSSDAQFLEVWAKTCV